MTRSPASGFPIPSAPICDPGTGVLTREWFDFLRTQYLRSGGPLGPLSPTGPIGGSLADAQALLAMADVPDAPPGTFPAPLSLTDMLAILDPQETPAADDPALLLADPPEPVNLDAPTLLALFATEPDVAAAGVVTFNTRAGAVALSSADVTSALTFTPYNASNPASYIAAGGAPVQTVAGRTGAVVLAVADVSGAAPLASPSFTGTVSMATALAIASGGTGSATAAAALTALGAYAAANPSGYQTAANVTTSLGPYALTSGLPTSSAAVPLIDGTAATGTAGTYAREGHVHPTDTTRYAASNPNAYIAASGAPVQTVAGRNGAVVLAVADVSGAAPLAAPALTGIPTAPTPAVSTNTTQLATTAYVLGQVATATPLVDGTAAVGTSLLYTRQDHVHPTDTTRAPLAGPSFTGTGGFQGACAFGTALANSLALFGSATGSPLTLAAQGTDTNVAINLNPKGTGAVTTNGAMTATTSLGVGTGGPTWTQGTAAPAATAPVGSLYSRVGGAVGATLYVSRGAGVWAAVAGV